MTDINVDDQIFVPTEVGVRLGIPENARAHYVGRTINGSHVLEYETADRSLHRWTDAMFKIVFVTDGVNKHTETVKSFTGVKIVRNLPTGDFREQTNKETVMRYAYVHLIDEWIIVTQSKDELNYEVWTCVPNLNGFVSLVEAQKYRDMFLK